VDLALYLKAAIMGLVEGLTEFLPISSTGHLILAGDLLGFAGPKVTVFEIVIQTGAMLAVLWEYRAKFLSVLAGLAHDRRAQRFALHVVIAFLPAAVMGVAFGSLIKAYLFKPVPVALAFIVGGLIIFWVERRPRRATIDNVDDLTWPVALKIGLAQCLALVPGTSRAGATIVGALVFGLSRRAATEFSFFLAVPTLMGAGAYDLYKGRALLSSDDIGWFGVGLLVAFLSALACVRWLLRYISSHDFTVFVIYRVVFGALVLWTAYAGIVEWTVR
jgi:undecaprenyl-diphosphatase